MAIYTSTDMIQDCRANKSEGWGCLITRYVPVMRTLLAHYQPARSESLAEVVLRGLHNADSPLWTSPPNFTEREFVAALRQEISRLVEADKASAEPEVPLDLETLTEALEGFTATERQFVWFETMAYGVEPTAKMMNLEPSTIQKARDRAEEGLRVKMDRWKRGMIADNGLVLGALAVAAKTDRCLPAKAFLDTIDGRITWKSKRDYETHMAQCWQCVDYFCRIREADFVLRFNKPLSEEEAKPLRTAFGLPEVKKTFMQRLMK